MQPLLLSIHRMLITAEKPLQHENAIGLRGYFGNAYRDNHHLKTFMEESAQYRYPRIQYKVIDGNGLVLGFGQGATVLRNLPLPESLVLGHETVLVVQLNSSDAESAWGFSEQRQTYRFLTPWLCLDEPGLAKYFRLKEYRNQKYFLEDLLIGNIVAISKNLEYRIPGPVNVSILELKPLTEMIHGKHTLSFKGSFAVNFDIPDHLGVGKSVARGYGTVKRLTAAPAGQ